VVAAVKAEMQDALRAPFPASMVGQLPKGGTTLDYVGHGAVTDRLLSVDPLWNWEPVAFDEQGLPLFQRSNEGKPVGLWIRLTVLGVTRLGYGSCLPGQFDAEKVLIGDALRNAAMRFGVALDLWIRGHAEDDESRTSSGPSRGRRSGPPACAICGESMAGAEATKTDEGIAHKSCATGEAS
jgi:hypothetical protein